MVNTENLTDQECFVHNISTNKLKIRELRTKRYLLEACVMFISLLINHSENVSTDSMQPYTTNFIIVIIQSTIGEKKKYLHIPLKAYYNYKYYLFIPLILVVLL